MALHPMGFSVPRRLRFERCALTAPFHHHRHPASGTTAVCFLWHYPSGRLAPSLPACIPSRKTEPVTRHRALWSSDFPPSCRSKRAILRPSKTAERIRYSINSGKLCKSKENPSPQPSPLGGRGRARPAISKFRITVVGKRRAFPIPPSAFNYSAPASTMSLV